MCVRCAPFAVVREYCTTLDGEDRGRISIREHSAANGLSLSMCHTTARVSPPFPGVFSPHIRGLLSTLEIRESQYFLYRDLVILRALDCSCGLQCNDVENSTVVSTVRPLVLYYDI